MKKILGVIVTLLLLVSMDHAQPMSGWQVVLDSVQTRLKLSGGTLTGNSTLNDNVLWRFGTGNDMSIYHDATDNHIKAANGDMKISTVGNNSIYMGVDNTLAWWFDGTATGDTLGALKPYLTGTYDIGTPGRRVDSIFTNNIKVYSGFNLGDNSRVYLGDGNDMSLVHDGASNYLYSTAKNFYLQATSTNNIYLGVGSVMDWYIDGSSEAGDLLPFTTGTVNIGSATKEVDSVFTQDITLTNDLQANDGSYLYLGESQLSSLTHSGLNFTMTNTTGLMTLSSTGGKMQLKTATYDMEFYTNSLERWYIDASDGDFIPNTTATHDIGSAANEVANIYVQSITMTDHLLLGDSDYLKLGASEDFVMGHVGGNTTGSNSVGDLTLNSAGGDFLLKTTGAYDLQLYANSTKGYYIEGTAGDTQGALIPQADATYDLGTYTVRPDSVFVDDLDVTNTVTIGSVIIDSDEAGKLDSLTVSAARLNNLTTEYRNFVVMTPQANDPILPIMVGNKTVTECYVLVTGTAGASVTFNIELGGTVAAGSGNDIFDTADEVATVLASPAQESLTANINGSVLDVETNHYIWLDISAVSGTVNTLTVTLGLTEGD